MPPWESPASEKCGHPLWKVRRWDVFRIFGLTPQTLRLSSVLPQMAVVLAILWLSDIAGFWIGRQARISLEELFGEDVKTKNRSGPRAAVRRPVLS